MKKKLAIVTTHPIQYNAPWFALLAQRNVIQIKIFYTWSQAAEGKKFDPGFNKEIEWDIPLLDGYDFEFVPNTSTGPGTRRYGGIRNPGLIDRIKDFNPDAVLVNGWNFHSHLACMRYFHKKIPVLFRGDSTLLDTQSGLKTLLRKLVLTKVFKNIDRALYVGTENKKYFLNHGLKEAQLYFTPHAIDNERFAISVHDPSASLRTRLGIGSEAIIILFAGKLEPKKDPQLLMEAFNMIVTKDVHLLIVGNGVLEAGLKSATTAQVHFMDFQNQQMMPDIYADCDVFVLPSKGPGETWGLAVNEAMAAGKCVIVSTKCGCSADLIEEGINGFTFAAGNKKELADRLQQCISDKERLKKMGERSAVKINTYSFKHIAAGIEAAVTDLKSQEEK